MVDNIGTAANSGTEDLAPSCLLELAADDDLERFKQQVVEAGVDIDEPGFWYCRHNGANRHRMVLEKRTPAMIAALYGSYQVLSYILCCYHSTGRDVNRRCGSDSITALHCAASGASKLAMEIIQLLLDFGADPLALDAHGCRPVDVIRVFPGAASHMKANLEAILLNGATPCLGEVNSGSVYDMLGVEVGVKEAVKPIRIPKLSSSPESSVLSSSPDSPTATVAAADGFLEKPSLREYCPIVSVAGGDPTLPDVKNSIYSTDEFRMFSFKVRQCSRAYSHDWTECPFVHPGENARRRDPRRYHYSCVPCPEFRKGCCKRGDTCEYAHGVFECWLHPAQYRTRLCKDGITCARRVCFFAHTTDELRPLYISTGSAVPSSSSPRVVSTSCSVDVSSLSPTLGPSSPSVFLQSCLQTPPASPSASTQGGLTLWQQQSAALTALHLPGLQSSRLRTARSAREILADDMTSPGYYTDFDGQFPSPSQVLSAQARWNAAVAAATSGCGATGGNSSPRVDKYRSLGFPIAPANLEDLFAPETTVPEPPPILLNTPLQQQQQQQNHALLLHSQLLAERNSRAYPQNPNAESRHKLLQSPSRSPSFVLSASHGHILPPPLMLDTDRQSNMTPPSSPAALSVIAQHEKRSHSSRELGSGLSLSDWGSPTGKPEWGMNREDLTKFRKSAPFGIWASEESEGQAWPQTHVKDSPADLNQGVGVATTTAASTNGLGDGGEQETTEHSALSSWIEQLRLDQIVA